MLDSCRHPDLSNPDSLDLIDGHLIAAAIVQTCCRAAVESRTGLRLFSITFLDLNTSVMCRK